MRLARIDVEVVDVAVFVVRVAQVIGRGIVNQPGDRFSVLIPADVAVGVLGDSGLAADFAAKGRSRPHAAAVERFRQVVHQPLGGGGRLPENEKRETTENKQDSADRTFHGVAPGK